MNLRLLLAMIAVPAAVWADGGTVQLRKEAGDLMITLFALPSPLAVGPSDISLLLQNRDGLQPVLDANVSLLLNQQASNMRVTATRQQASNKLLYAAPVTFPKSGKWRIAITVECGGKKTGAQGFLEVIPASGESASYAGYVAFPPVVIVLFIVRERLIRQKSKGK
jgi:hypothetical protein